MFGSAGTRHIRSAKKHDSSGWKRREHKTKSGEEEEERNWEEEGEGEGEEEEEWAVEGGVGEGDGEEEEEEEGRCEEHPALSLVKGATAEETRYSRKWRRMKINGEGCNKRDK